MQLSHILTKLAERGVQHTVRSTSGWTHIEAMGPAGRLCINVRLRSADGVVTAVETTSFKPQGWHLPQKNGRVQGMKRLQPSRIFNRPEHILQEADLEGLVAAFAEASGQLPEIDLSMPELAD